MEIAIGWAALSGLVAWFAATRGRNWALALLAALALSPLLAFLGYAIAGRSEAQRRARIEEEERWRREARGETAEPPAPSALDRAVAARRAAEAARRERDGL